MRHINECNRGYSVVTGSPKTSGCDYRVTEDFWVWPLGHQMIFGVVTGSRTFFSTVAWGHGAVLCRAVLCRAELCRAESKNFAHTSNGAASAYISSAAHALSESRHYITTVKPPNKGHFGDGPVVPCREVVLFSEVFF